MIRFFKYYILHTDEYTQLQTYKDQATHLRKQLTHAEVDRDAFFDKMNALQKQLNTQQQQQQPKRPMKRRRTGNKTA